MKLTMKFLVVAAMLTGFTLPALAQTKECNEENKAAWYKTFLDNFRGDGAQQKTAYDAAKTYLDSCPADPNDKIAEYMREKFVKPYEKATADITSKNQMEEAFTKKNYPEVVRAGKVVLSSDADYIRANLLIAIAGYSASTSGNTSLMADAVDSAKKAIAQIEAGKPFAPYASKDQALGSLHYIIAKSMLKDSPTEAIPHLLMAAKLNGDLKKDPQVYNELGAAYGEQVDKLTKDYQQYIGKPETNESKLVLANLNQAIDVQIDALARATALADAANKPALMDRLTELYKFRHKSDSGLTDLLASVLAKPLPDQPKPITELPSTPTPSGTPTPGTTNGSSSGSASNSTTTNGQKTGSGGTNGSTGGNGGNKTQPTGTRPPATSNTTPKKPRRSNHVRG